MPENQQVDVEIAEQRQLALEFMASTREGIDTGAVSDAMARRVEGLLSKHGLSAASLSDARRRDLSEGVARALIEQQNLFLLRLEDRLASFSPADPLFRQPVAQTYEVTNLEPATLTAQKVKGPTLGTAVETYLKAKTAAWRPRTLKARKWQLGYLVECLGAAMPLASVSPDHIRSFRDCVLALRANHGRSETVSLAEKQTDNLAARIQSKTAAIIFEPTKAFFSWAEGSEGLIATNPSKNITMPVAKKAKGTRGRRPFEAKEIVQLFSCPLFTGCKSVHRRFEPGSKVVRDGKFLLPILGYYTGCRLGELVQLSIQDAHVEGDYPYLDINEKAVAGGDEKSVKSDAGIRRAPLHRDVMALGFGDFVAKRRGQDKPVVRLFKEIKYGCDGPASTEYSKIFARLMEKVGLTDPQLVFHSWRHGVEDALRDAGVQPYTIDRILGHADATMGGKYGKGVSLHALYDAVASMKLPISLCEVITPPG